MCLIWPNDVQQLLKEANKRGVSCRCFDLGCSNPMEEMDEFRKRLKSAIAQYDDEHRKDEK